MEQKKSPKANLENKRNTFFMLGLVIALGATLLAFEWTRKPEKADLLEFSNGVDVEEEIIPVTKAEEVKPPPPPPPPKVIEILNIVDNETDITEELDIDDSGADDQTIIDVDPYVSPIQKEEEKEEEIFTFVEQPAEFPGGERALYKYISNSIRYPVIAQENGIQGKVYVRFVVNENGNVSSAEILRGVDISLDREALRVINSLPGFKPGKQAGRSVKVYYMAVINFKLQ